MVSKFRSSLSYANVMATVAVFLALGGGAYAAIKVPKNGVGSAQLKPNSVTSVKVKNHSLKAVDFKSGQLPAGAQGPQGIKGDTGAPGSAVAYAHVLGDGTLDSAHSKNVTAVSKPNGSSSPTFCLTASVPVSNAIATVDAGNSGGLQGDAVAVLAGQDPGNRIPTICTAGGNVLVSTETQSGSLTGLAFWIVFE